MAVKQIWLSQSIPDNCCGELLSLKRFLKNSLAWVSDFVNCDSLHAKLNSSDYQHCARPCIGVKKYVLRMLKSWSHCQPSVTFNGKVLAREQSLLEIDWFILLIIVCLKGKFTTNSEYVQWHLSSLKSFGVLEG